MLEAPAVVAGLDDIAMVGDVVEQRGGHLGITEDGRPLAEGEVGGDDDRGLLVEFADQVEQQLPTGTGERQIAQFIEHHEIEPAELGGYGTGLADAGFLLKPGNKVDRVEVAPAGAGADDAGGDRGGQVGLASARSADEHDIAPPWQERTGVQRTNQPFVNRRAVEHEGVDVLDHGKLGRGHTVADRGGMAMRGFGPQQVGQDLVVVRLRCSPVVTASSNALAMPLRPSPRIASIISCRCIDSSHRVVSGAVRNRRMAELEVDDHVEKPLGCRLAVSGQDVEDHLVAGGAGIERFADSGLDCVQAIGQHGSQHPDEAPVGLIAAPQLAPQPRQCRRQVPALEGCAVAQGPRLVGQDGKVMPRIVDRPITAEVPGMFSDDFITQTHDDPVGIGADLDGTPRRLGHDGIAVAVEADQAGSGHGMGGLVEAIEWCQHRLQGWPLDIQRLGNGQFLLLGTRVQRGPAQALSLEPPIELLDAGKGWKKRPRMVWTWFSTCPFSQPAAGEQAVGSTM